MEKKNETAMPSAVLILAAVIWGFAFVAQRAGMEHVGPFTFNGVQSGWSVMESVEGDWLRIWQRSSCGWNGWAN